MPRAMKAIVVDTTLAEPERPKLAPVPANLDQPDHVACERCGESSAATATRCPGCGLRFDDAAVNNRMSIARRQTLAAGERAQREHTKNSRLPDPGLASTVVDALALVVRDIERHRAAALAEVEASKERFEKAVAVVFANDDKENRDARDRAHAEMTSAPYMVERWEGAIATAQSLLPLAEESDALVAAGPSAEDFRAELAERMAAARKHFAAAFTEVAGAFDAQRKHGAAMRSAHGKRKELDQQLTGIKRSLSLQPKLQHGFGRYASHEEVSEAAVKVIIEVLNASGIDGALVDDIRARVRWQ